MMRDRDNDEKDDDDNVVKFLRTKSESDINKTKDMVGFISALSRGYHHSKKIQIKQ